MLDVWGMTRSTAAMIQGYEAFDPGVRIAGFILNRAGSRKHFEMIRDGLPPSLRERLLGYLPADDALSVAERHLGLVTLEETPGPALCATRSSPGPGRPSTWTA